MAPVTPSEHLLSRYQGSERTVNRARTLGPSARARTLRAAAGPV